MSSESSGPKRPQAKHGVVCRLAGAEEGYFGWPSVARTDDGTLVVAASGPRVEHVCPFGKTSIFLSSDDGQTWSAPRVINDSPIDDRDAGIVSLGGPKLLVSWFTVDSRRYFQQNKASLTPSQQARAQALIASWTDEVVQKWLGSWAMLSDDGGANWSAPIQAPVSTPHGPIRLANGDLLYLGKRYGRDLTDREIMAYRSSDGGRTWRALGAAPVAEGTRHINYHEPHVVELPTGRLIGLIRFQFMGEDDPARGRQLDFSMFQTASDDGGATWTTAQPTGVYGSPPHLIRHSSGKLVCVYGYRKSPTGQRAMISPDDGQTWDADWILRDDGPGWDLGYPCSVELPDGSIFTVYYQKYAPGEPCSVLWSRWRLP